MVLDLEINGITQTERCIRSQNNDGPRFRRDTGLKVAPNMADPISLNEKLP